MARHNQLEKLESTNSYILRNRLGNQEKVYFVNHGKDKFNLRINSKMFQIESTDASTSSCLFQSKDFLGYWIGFDPSIECCHGNTILIKITPTSYICIADRITAWNTRDEIIDYVSQIGIGASTSKSYHNIAYGEECIYFVREHKFLKRDHISTSTRVSISAVAALYAELSTNGLGVPMLVVPLLVTPVVAPAGTPVVVPAVVPAIAHTN